MPEDFYLFDDAVLPSKESGQGKILAEDGQSLLSQCGTFPLVCSSLSPSSPNDVPQPSIEIDTMEDVSYNSMFVTPEPDEKCRRLPTPFSKDYASESIYRTKLHRKQASEVECIIVDEAGCSPESHQLWSMPESNQKGFGGSIFSGKLSNPDTKIEPKKPANLMEIQRRLIAQHSVARLHRSGAPTSFASRMSRQRSFSRSPQTKSKSRRGTIYRQKNLDDIVDVKAEFKTLMRRVDESSKWMDEHDDGSGENEELDTLEKLRQSLQQQQNTGNLTEVETIEMMKVDQQVKLRNRRQEAVNRLNQRDVVSIPSDSEGGDDGAELRLRQARYNQSDEDDQIAQRTEMGFLQGIEDLSKQPKLKAVGKSAKGRTRKIAKTAREVEEMRRGKAREKERKKRERLAHSKRVPQKGKISRKHGKGAAKKSHKSHMESAGNGRDTLKALLQDLVHSDFIADRLAQGEFSDAPEINETRKEKALHALLASAPDNYDTHRAKTDKSDLAAASKRFGFGRVKWIVDGSWKLKGMASHLYHHQLLGADWMLSRELGEEGPFGGLLADAMGLGKTLQMLATMVGNPPSKEDVKANRKATLIVLPASAIRQWMDEIEIHVDQGIFPKIMRYKANMGVSLNILQECDIVLTSYAEVMASFPLFSREELEKYECKGGYNKWLEKSKGLAGQLHKITWHRIVLDEAHAIKNYKSRTSLACRNLLGKYRWALSGTPIQNRLDELFPYLRFLRTQWTRDYTEFRKHFCDPEADGALARVHVILSIVMRRTMKDKIFGRPIVELPPIHPETQFVCFSKEEATLYRIIENRFRDNLNKHFAKGTAERNYTMWMVQILRLRQCTSHPLLLEKTVREIFQLEDICELKTEWKRLSRNKQPLYEQINQWVQQTEEERLESQANGEPTLASGEIQPFGISEFGKYFKMANLLCSINSEDLIRRVVCRICGDLPQDALITDCHHIFCRHCLDSHQQAEELRGDDTEYNICPEPCRRIYMKATTYMDLSLLDGMTNVEDNENPRQKKSTRKRGKRGDEDCLDSKCTWLATVMKIKPLYLPPSAKTIALKAKILHWINESPNDKIIIFTQWKAMIKIVGMICAMEGWGFCEFTGDMSLDQRHASVKNFHTNPEIKIMIANLKCGGQALNLTCANRVISIDLWWNHSIEQQAFGRVYRIGQHKETFVTRLVVRNTIDQRLLSMQADKVRRIDSVMQDTNAPVMEPLSMLDLASLFGHLREQDDGTMRVEPDYEQEDEEDDDQGSAPEEELQMS